MIAWTMHPNPALGFELVSREQLYRESDVISLHLRLSDQTRAIVGEREFGMMKRSAILICTARGGLVDQPALVEALRSGRLAAAGLDVFMAEPVAAEETLLKLDNVVLTPHLAWLTAGTLRRSLEVAVENCRRLMEGEPLLYRVV